MSYLRSLAHRTLGQTPRLAPLIAPRFAPVGDLGSVAAERAGHPAQPLLAVEESEVPALPKRESVQARRAPLDTRVGSPLQRAIEAPPQDPTVRSERTLLAALRCASQIETQEPGAQVDRPRSSHDSGSAHPADAPRLPLPLTGTRPFETPLLEDVEARFLPRTPAAPERPALISEKDRTRSARREESPPSVTDRGRREGSLSLDQEGPLSVERSGAIRQNSLAALSQPAQLSPDASAEALPPSVHVHIGRIEVSAPKPAPKPAPTGMARSARPMPKPGLSLSEYLARQQKGSAR